PRHARPMRIAYLAEPDSGNGFYRGIGPMTALEQCRGHSVRRLSTDEDRPPLADVRNVDVLHVHRYCDERALRLIREAKAHGAALVWDNDDDITAVPKGTPAYRFFGGMQGERRRAGMKRIFGVADLVTAPSRVLAERLRAAGAPRAEVIENQLPDQFLKVDRRPHRGVTIGWIAGLEHQLDAERIPIRATLQRLLDEREDVNVVTFGLRLGLRSERYRAVDVVPLFELTQEAAAFDIGIAPLADIDLSRARSNIKLKEYAAAGAPWLASPIGPYAGMGEKQGGRLVADDGWHEQLTRLIDKPRERRKLAKRATKWVAGETLTKHAADWEAKLAAAVERARAAA
ncbi:MAG: glycosyltransferase, partial [Conexibacter sp.]